MVAQFIHDPAEARDELKEIKSRIQDDHDSETNMNHDDLSDYLNSASSDDVYTNNNSLGRDIDAIQLPELPKILQDIENKKYYDDLTKKMNESLGLEDEVKSFLDTRLWERLYEYIQKHIGDFIIDGRLSIQLHIRYFLCTFIVAFIPGEFVILYPTVWIRLVPTALLKEDFFKRTFTSLRIFQDFVKERGKKEFLITFYFGRANTLLEDLKFLAKIPFMILSDMRGLISELINFEIRSEGFEEYKEKNKDKIYW